MLHRPSGLLTLWRAEGPRQDEIQIIIESGRPTHARRGLYEEYISTSTLLWLSSWRNIYFTFQTKRALLQLPAPDSRHSSVTRPLPTVSPSQSASQDASTPGTAIDDKPSSPPSPLERLVPSLTDQGRNFPLTALPRYDRTIFLLINSRRTIADIAQLTRRSPAAIFASLSRLKKQQLIVWA